MLTDDDGGTFGVDRDGNLYKATNKTNFETKTKHRITVMISDNGNPQMKVFRDFLIPPMVVNFMAVFRLLL